MEKYQSRYKNLEKLTKKWDALPSQTRAEVDKIFQNVTDAQGIIMCVGNGANFKMLMEYLCNLCLNDKAGAKELGEVFDAIFEMYAAVNPHMVRLETVAGDLFDTAQHVRVGKPASKIVEVKFRGVKNNKTDEIIQKSIVAVG